jgi:hypothetical protein
MTEHAFQPDQNEAKRFLALLDPNATRFTFQTFDDNEERKEHRKETHEKDPFAKIIHGTLAEHFDELVRLNAEGAGIFVTINETDFRGRKNNNIVKVRSLFVDLDGAPLDPVLSNQPTPHIIVESSPGKWHVYWRINDVALNNFTSMQKVLIARFGGDRVIHNLNRVMRLPGFAHAKSEPSMVRIVEVNEAPLYSVSDFPEPVDEVDPVDLNRDAGKGIAHEHHQWTRLNSAALANLSAWVPDLFGNAAQYQPGTGAYRISSKALKRNLQEDLSIHPEGIMDFGIADQGDAREGKRTPIDIVVKFGDKDFGAAVEWLQERVLPDEGVSLDDFYAYMPQHNYIYIPSRDLWPSASVNARIPPIPITDEDGNPEHDEQGNEKKLKANAWLDQNRPVEQMTWAPGLPMLIPNRLVSDGGWIERQGVSCFNLFRPPTIELGDPTKADPWRNHIRKVYPDDADHIIYWLAHRRQKPQDKINHGLLLGGPPGIGKDTLLEPAKHAVGPWNFHEISRSKFLVASTVSSRAPSCASTRRATSATSAATSSMMR